MNTRIRAFAMASAMGVLMVCAAESGKRADTKAPITVFVIKMDQEGEVFREAQVSFLEHIVRKMGADILLVSPRETGWCYFIRDDKSAEFARNYVLFPEAPDMRDIRLRDGKEYDQIMTSVRVLFEK